MSQYEKDSAPEIRKQKEFEEDVCVICCTKCRLRRSDNNEQSKSSGQFPAHELLTLMDAPVDEPPETVTLCVACAFRVGKLQAFHEELVRVQIWVMELRQQIACALPVLDGKNEENVVRASLCKRRFVVFWLHNDLRCGSVTDDSCSSVFFDRLESSCRERRELGCKRRTRKRENKCKNTERLDHQTNQSCRG